MELRVHDPITMDNSPEECCVTSVHKLIRSKREWVAKLLTALLELGGFSEVVPWQGFLFVLLRFCSLSRLELAQVMFYIISREQKSWTVHYITTTQLEVFYEMYSDCPHPSFNTGSIDFTSLATAKILMVDYIQLTYQFSQLLNPCLHLQRCMQQRLPSLSFWRDFDRVTTLNQHVGLDFFRFRKSLSLIELMAGAVKQHESLSAGGDGTWTNEALGSDLDGVAYDPRTQIKRKPAVESDVLMPLPGPGPPGWSESKPLVHDKDKPKALPAWMEEQVMQNYDPKTYTPLGTAAILAPKPTWDTPLKDAITVEHAKDVIMATHRPSEFTNPRSGKRPSKTDGSKVGSHDFVRAKELDFIAKSRERKKHEVSLLMCSEQATEAPLIKRPV